MIRRKYGDQRFRDETNLIRLVEHLERAHRDASAVASAQELEGDYMRFNSVAMDMVQAQESARKLSDEFRNETHGVSCVRCATSSCINMTRSNRMRCMNPPRQTPGIYCRDCVPTSMP